MSGWPDEIRVRVHGDVPVSSETYTRDVLALVNRYDACRRWRRWLVRKLLGL